MSKKSKQPDATLPKPEAEKSKHSYNISRASDNREPKTTACETAKGDDEMNKTTYTIKDANSSDSGLTFLEAVERIAEWYEDCDQWATGDGDDATHEAIAEAIDSIEKPESGDLSDLQDYADAICDAVARACGNGDFAGHGSYFVSAASQGGFSLMVEEIQEEESIVITKQALDTGKIIHIGWSLGRDVAEQCGVNVSDYFDLQGRYLGPDENGLEPVFETADDSK